MMTKHCEQCGHKIRVREPNALGYAPRDPHIDIALEQLRGRNMPPSVKQMARRRLEQSAPHLLDGLSGAQL